MAEVNRNLAENFGMTDEQVAHRASEIRRYFPEAWVEGCVDLIPAMTNHPKDRHVLAAGVRSSADVILTYNMPDFPKRALEPYSIAAMGPSAFLRSMYELDSEFVKDTLQRQARSIGKTVDYVLDRLSINAPGFVCFFRSVHG